MEISMPTLTNEELENLLELHEETNGDRWTVDHGYYFSAWNGTYCHDTYCVGHKNAEFIVEAHRLVPSLVEEILTLRKKLEE
jgi:hypothetical protein